MELLNDTGVEVATGNIVLMMLEYFIGTAERSSELGGQEGLLGSPYVEENEVTRLVDVLYDGVMVTPSRPIRLR